MRFHAALLTLCFLTGCSSDDATPASKPHRVLVSTELTTRWKLLPHRVSLLEIASLPHPESDSVALVGQNEGGSFAIFDEVVNRQAFTLYQSSALRAVEASVQIEIPGPGSTLPEDFVASGDARVAAGALGKSEALVALVRGFRLSTNEYATPPPFASDPDLPYDPAQGFTTQGIGIQLGSPTLDGDDVVVPVSVRNSLGPADRPDMNAAMPKASSWVRVDLVVVGAPGASSAAYRGEASYTLSTASYGKNTEHPHADAASQLVTVSGTPGLSAGLLGISGFDIWLNAPGHIDPDCAVVQDPINAWKEPVSGPGRYLTELSVRLLDPSYEPQTGSGSARVDLYLSNRSTVKEVGNLCLGMRGEVSLLQLDASVDDSAIPAAELALTPGEVSETSIGLQ
jgi:hypothetical protein